MNHPAAYLADHALTEPADDEPTPEGDAREAEIYRLREQLQRDHDTIVRLERERDEARGLVRLAVREWLAVPMHVYLRMQTATQRWQAEDDVGF